jgi:hypothetical protein
MSTKRRSRSISPPQTVRRDLLKQEKAYAKAFELLRDDIKEKGVINLIDQYIPEEDKSYLYYRIQQYPQYAYPILKTMLGGRPRDYLEWNRIEVDHHAGMDPPSSVFHGHFYKGRNDMVSFVAVARNRFELDDLLKGALRLSVDQNPHTFNDFRRIQYIDIRATALPRRMKRKILKILITPAY